MIVLRCVFYERVCEMLWEAAAACGTLNASAPGDAERLLLLLLLLHHRSRASPCPSASHSAGLEEDMCSCSDLTCCWFWLQHGRRFLSVGVYISTVCSSHLTHRRASHYVTDT